MGNLGRTKEMAKSALVFMLRGLHKKWKQPIAFYFLKNSVKAIYLKQLILKVAEELLNRGFQVVSTVCDQGSSNVSAIRKLQKETCIDAREGPYFFVNNQQIVTFFDTPHLLKNTRNALAKYNIRYSNEYVAKWKHLIDAYKVDSKKRFPMLHKIRECYFHINNPSNRALKMKVAPAAKIFSHTMSSAIETAIAISPDTVPNQAIHTATFVKDINDLFDSMNSNQPTRNKSYSLKCAIRNNSHHVIFWNSMMSKIASWEFECPRSGQTVNVKMKFQDGWLNNIRAFKDCLENLFAVIRQHGGGNSYPSCYQFTSALKTSILNNLVGSFGRDQNCEKDDLVILDNLKEFVDDGSTRNRRLNPW